MYNLIAIERQSADLASKMGYMALVFEPKRNARSRTQEFSFAPAGFIQVVLIAYLCAEEINLFPVRASHFTCGLGKIRP
jgi:hypothetical protein